MEKENFSEYFWRGIPNKDFVSDGHVLALAFQFEEANREDNYKELSINWADDDNALKKLLEQQKDNGKLQFAGGVTRLSLSSVKMFFRSFIDSKQFSYERKPIDDNDYHGNLLVSSDLNKQLRSQISHGLALVAGTYIVKQDELI